MIGAGIATIALAGAAIGIGQIFAAFVSGSFRNPEAPRVFANVILGFALAEATGLFGLVVALLLLFVL
jgi:F-type H+-transporting ATPase subunit c